jgi:Na+/phosphate symporter
MEEGFRARMGRRSGPLGMILIFLVGVGMLLYGLFTLRKDVILYGLIVVGIGLAVYALQQLWRPTPASSPATAAVSSS